MAVEALSRVTIRRAEAADAHQVAAMLDRLAAEVGGAVIGPNQTPDPTTLKCASQLLAIRDQVIGLVAELDGAPVGVLMASTAASVGAGGRYGRITELWVAPENRGRGIARALIETMGGMGRPRGWTLLEAPPPPDASWDGAAAFYEREGFRPHGGAMRLPI